MKNLNSLTLAAVAAASLAWAGCSSSKTPAASDTASATTTTTTEAPSVKGIGLDPANIDSSVQPCDNFFQYASGTWLKNNPIPAAESRWSSWNGLINQNEAVMRQILQEAAANTSAAKGSNAQKVGDFYASAMDSAAIEAAGLKPVQSELNRIAAIKDLKGLQAALARQQMLRTRSVFGAGVAQDRKISTQYAVYLSQGGLSLPDRDYYLKEDGRSKTIRTAYTTYLTNMFTLLGDNAATAARNANTVMRLETRLAKASKDRVAMRDPYANYNKMTVAEANKQFPNMNVPGMLQQLGVGSAKEVIVGQPEFLKEASTALKSEPLADWKTYLRWHVVSVGGRCATEGLRRRVVPLHAGADGSQGAAAPLEAHAARHRRRVG